MSIPAFLDRDDYLQNPVMRRFLKKHKIELANSRADYIKAIERFSSQNEQCTAEERYTILKIGTKIPFLLKPKSRKPSLTVQRKASCPIITPANARSSIIISPPTNRGR